MNESKKYIPNLTPLRGVAALWVAVFHFEAVIARFVSPGQTHLLEKGYLMVDLFFILSGFIISHVYEPDFEWGVSAGKFGRFITARFARIYPLHLFTLLCLVTLVASLHAWSPVFDPRAIVANIFLLHSFGLFSIFTWNIPSWSITAEWWAYMLFPLLAFFISRRPRFAIGILTASTILAYWAILYGIPRAGPPTMNVTFDYGWLRGLAGFVTGMLVYRIYRSSMEKARLNNDGLTMISLLLALAFLHLGLKDGLIIPVFALIVLCFACNNGLVRAICNHRLPQFLGNISYSIYMVQALLLILFLLKLVKLPGVEYHPRPIGNRLDFWPGSFWCLCYLLVLVGISTLTYYGIELPARKYINRRFKSSQPETLLKYK